MPCIYLHEFWISYICHKSLYILCTHFYDVHNTVYYYDLLVVFTSCITRDANELIRISVTHYNQL